MKMITIFRLYSIIFLFGYLSISIFNFFPAQNTINLTIRDGLPTNVVRCMHKAKNGVLWIGTDAGLCSYDGRELVIYDQNDGLPNNLVWALTECEEGKIWIGCYGAGLVYYDGSRFVDCSKDIPSKSIRTLYYDNDLVYIGTDRHFMIYDGSAYYHSEDQFQTMKVIKKDTSVFVVTRRKGLYKLVFGKEKRINFSLDSCSYHGMLFGAINYFEDLLLFKNKGVKFISYDSIKSEFKSGRLFDSPSVAWDAVVTNDSSVYLAQWGVTLKNGGLFRLKNGSVSLVNNEYGIESKEISCLHYDEFNEILWVGSIHNGLYKVMLNGAVTFPSEVKNEDKKGILMVLKKENNKLFYLKENGIYSAEKNEGTKLLCSKEKLINLIKSHPKWKIKANKSARHRKDALESLNNLSYFNSQIENKMIWLSTDHGLFRFNTNSKKLDHQYISGPVFYKTDSVLFFHKPYRYLEKYPDVFNSNTGFKYTTDDAPKDLTQIIKYNNSIWFASYSRGLLKQNEDEFISYFRSNKINESYINHLKVWNDTILVVSSGTGNVYGIKEKEDSVEVIFKLLSGDQIDGNQIYFLETSNDLLLVGTNRGLVIYDGLETRLINDEEGYFMRDVASTLEVSDGVLLSDKNTLIKLDVEKLIFQNKNSLYAKSFHTIDSIYKENLDSLSALTFPYNRNYYEVKFRYANLINPLKDVFTYDLHRWDRKKWVNEYNSFFDPNKLSVWCTNLSPGKYRLRLNAKNKYTNKEAHSKYYHFQIIPPFWKTIWFLVSFSIFLILSIIFIIRYFIIRLKEKDKINLRISEIRLEALKAQMNPHFTFNIMNSIQNFVLDKNVDKALVYIGNFSKLIRAALDYSNKKTISLNEEINFLQNYVGLQNMRFGEKVHFNLNFPKDYIHKILIPPMIIQPLIENVFVHAFSSESVKPQLDVNIFLKEDIIHAKTLYIEVKDNGVGRSEEKKNTHLSKGLSIIQERLQLINKTNRTSIVLNYHDLKNDNKESVGTKVQLQVPLVIN